MSDQHLEQYRKVLGVDADATLDEINTTYFHWLEKIPENPTEAEEQLQLRLKHAYSVLKRNCVTPSRAVLHFEKRHLLPIAALLLVASVTFLALNWSDLKMMVTHYAPGEVLRWQNQDAPYGEIVRYEKTHQFHSGKPSPAYQIRLLNEDRTVWLGERLVIKGMAPFDMESAEAAGFSPTSD